MVVESNAAVRILLSAIRLALPNTDLKFEGCISGNKFLLLFVLELFGLSADIMKAKMRDIMEVACHNYCLSCSGITLVPVIIS